MKLQWVAKIYKEGQGPNAVGGRVVSSGPGSTYTPILAEDECEAAENFLASIGPQKGGWPAPPKEFSMIVLKDTESERFITEKPDIPPNFIDPELFNKNGRR